MLDDVVAFCRSVLLNIFFNEVADDLTEICHWHGGLGKFENKTTVHQQRPGDTLGSKSILKHLLALGIDEGRCEHHLAVQHEVAFPDNTREW